MPLCWLHHRLYETRGVELLPHLEPAWREEVAHLGLIGAVRALAPGGAEVCRTKDPPDWAGFRR